MCRLFLFAFTTISIAGLLTGCGRPEAKELVRDAFSREIDSATISTEFTLDIESDGDDDISSEVDIDLNIGVSGWSDIDDMTASISGSAHYDLLDGEFESDEKIEAYLVNDDGDCSFYFKDDEWYLVTGDMEDISDKLYGIYMPYEDVVDALLSSEKFWKEATVSKKQVDIGGEKCYELVVTPTGEDLYDFIYELSEASWCEDDLEKTVEYIEEVCDADIEDILDAMGIELRLYVTKNEHRFAGFSIDMSELDLGDVLGELGMDMDDLAYELDMDIEDIEIKELRLSVELSDIDNTEVDIPKKVTRNATEYDESSSATPAGSDPGSIDSGVNSSTNTGMLDLKTFDGVKLYTFKIPFGYRVDYVSDGGTYYSLQDSQYHHIYINIYASSSVNDYLINGQIPDEHWFPDFSCEYEEYTKNGINYYIAEYQYDMGDGWGMYDAIGVYIPYTDRYGNTQLMEVEMPYGYGEDYDIDDEVIIELAEDILNLK